MAEKEQEEGEGEGQGGSKKLIIIIGAVVALLLIGGLAAFFLMGGDDEEVAAEGDGAKQEETKKSSGVDAEGNPLPPLYYALKPAFLANLPPDSKQRLLQVSVHVMSRQQGMIDFLDQNKPMVTHHLLNLFNGQNSEELKSRAGKEKLQAAVKEKIQSLADEMGADGKVDNVFFSKLVME